MSMTPEQENRLKNLEFAVITLAALLEERRYVKDLSDEFMDAMRSNGSDPRDLITNGEKFFHGDR